MACKHVTNENFKESIASGLVVVDFWAEWCGPCRMLGPVLDEICDEMSEVYIIKVNVEEAEDVTTEYGIQNLPTLLIFKDGEKVDMKVGSDTKNNIIEWIKTNS